MTSGEDGKRWPFGALSSQYSGRLDDSIPLRTYTMCPIGPSNGRTWAVREVLGVITDDSIGTGRETCRE